MARGERGKGQKGISISLSEELLAEVNELAKADHRTRSNWIRHILTEAVNRRLAEKKITLLPAADAGDASSPSTVRYSARKQPPDPSLNESNSGKSSARTSDE